MDFGRNSLKKICENFRRIHGKNHLQSVNKFLIEKVFQDEEVLKLLEKKYLRDLKVIGEKTFSKFLK